MNTENFESVKIKLADPKEIRSWSHGEVLEPETINYRTLKPEKDGLFCERIFGPSKDYQCYCGKYKGRRYKGIVCDRCGVEITSSRVRRERMGHIELASPVAHIWFLRSIPSRMGMVLGVSRRDLSKVAYFVAYIITNVSEESKTEILDEIQEEYKAEVKEAKKEFKDNEKELKDRIRKIKKARGRAVDEVEKLKNLNILSEVEYRKLSLKYGEAFEAKTGAEAIYDLFKDVDLKEEIKNLRKEAAEAPSSRKDKVLRRLKFFEGLEKADVKPENMFLKVLPVLPPGLRPMVQLDGGKYASSDLNDLYRRVINRNNRLKYLLKISAPEVIVRNEKRMLQEAVDALIDNGMKSSTVTRPAAGGKRPLKSLADILKGKEGRFRRNLLGKRVDYSGRSVIIVGPNLPLDTVGVPKEMALEIFKPFVIRELLEREIAYNVRGSKELIEKATDEVWAVLEEVVKGKYVLLNRAPTLHRISIQAFKPVLIEGRAIRIPPLVCSAFNADFDGDQMALHLPLSEEGQKEAKELMISSRNLLKPAHGKPIINPSQDMIMGNYWLTTFKEGVEGEGKVFHDMKGARLAYESGLIDLRAKIKIYSPLIDKKIKGLGPEEKLLETSVGRIIFNNVLPEECFYWNKRVDSGDLSKITWNIIKNYEKEKAGEIVSEIKDLGFKYAMDSGISLGMDDFVVPEEKKEIVEEAEKEVEKAKKLVEKGLLSPDEEKERIIETWTEAKQKIEEIVPKKLSKHSPVFIIPDSGSRGSWVQPIQIGGMRGLMASPSGETIELPVKSSFKEGLKVLEYFISTHGSRKGISDKALGTAKAGYLTRRLVDVAHNAIVREKDCGDKEGKEILLEDAKKLGQNFGQKVAGRVALETIKGEKGKTIVKKGEIIQWEEADEMEEQGVEKVKVRSPLSCKTLRGVCQKCYGWDMGIDKMVDIGQAVGVVAAQSIGEPGTQLTMRTFHTGGVAGDTDITQGLPRVEEIFEARNPKGKAVISKVFGKVVSVKDNVVEIKPDPASKKKKTKSDIIKYKIPESRRITVEAGERVEKGQPLCLGSINPDELFKLRGEKYTRSYLLNEAQKIYTSQGVTIHDKHLEVVIGEMFSRIKITDPGDTSFLPGEITSKASLKEANEKLGKGKKKGEANPLVLGVSKVSLNSDSVLSAASFQRTSQVLIDACLRGKEDPLRGPKENVIVGKLVPVGTGFPAKKEEE